MVNMSFQILFMSLIIMKQAFGLPDLTLDGARMQRTAYIDYQRISSSSCAIYECGTGVGRRLLLRFDGAIPNVGTTDLHFGIPREDPHNFVWDDCHRHYHFNHFMDYKVFHYDNETYPDAILEGEKRAFCLRDDGWASRSLLNKYGIRPKRIRDTFDCDNQGIHVGYQDVYGRELECQWVDVTPLEAGRYKMRAEVNPIRVIKEERYDNNVAWIEFDTPGSDDDSDSHGGNTPRPTSRPTDRPERGGGGNNCGTDGHRCEWSTECCGFLRCQRERFGRSGVCG